MLWRSHQPKRNTVNTTSSILYLQDEFNYFSGQASTISRQIALGGLAIIWIFNERKESVSLPHELTFPLLLILASLAADLLQYLYGSIVWGVIHDRHERKRASENSTIYVSRLFDTPTWLLFVAKFLCLIIAYAQLFIFINQRITEDASAGTHKNEYMIIRKSHLGIDSTTYVDTLYLPKNSDE